MKIQDSKELRDLSTMCALPKNILCDRIINTLIKRGMLFDNETFYGISIKELCHENNYMLSSLTLEIFFIAPIGFSYFYAEQLLAKCILIGDGECPLCGGNCEEIDGEYEQVGGDSWNTEPEYEPMNQEWRCGVCGNIFSTGYQTDPDEMHDRKALNK